MIKRNYKEEVRYVACPVCKAKKGSPCIVLKTGKPATPHRARVQAYGLWAARLVYSERPKQTVYFYRRRDQLDALEGEHLNDPSLDTAPRLEHMSKQLQRFEAGEIKNLFVNAAAITGWHLYMPTDRVRLEFLGPPESWPYSDRAQASMRIRDSRVSVRALPYVHVPDWQQVGDTVWRCGAMALGLEVTKKMAASAHVVLHRRGMGIYMTRDAAGDHNGWLVQPLKGKK